MKTIPILIGFFALTLAADAGPATDQLVAANTAFAFDLFGHIAQAQPGKNIFISPFSASSALQMTAVGAAGQTKAEMGQVLRTSGMSENSLNTAVKALDGQFLDRKDVTLNLANGIWIQKGLLVKSTFTHTVQDFYDAELAQVDFGQPDSAGTINQWAAAKTNNKIKDVVHFPFPSLTRLILANAVYFKGTWVTAFEKSATRPRDFHLATGGSTRVPMMSQDGRFAYKEGNSYQAVKLPYKGGLEMELYLPQTNGNPVDLAGKKELREGFSTRDGTVMLPRFKMNYAVSLNEPLEAMGMKQAFSALGADFSAMANRPLFITEVKQKSYVDVNEQGTEAAAVTTVELTDAAMPVATERFTMILDHPFFFVISDMQSGSILFMGIVNDPTR
jgi:serpin B